MDYAVVTSKARGFGASEKIFQRGRETIRRHDHMNTSLEPFIRIISTAGQTLSKQVTGKQDKCQNMVVCNVSSWKRRNDYE